MDRTELALARLSNQYLLRTGKRMEVLRAMNGFQAQFLSNALHAMRLRSTAYDAAYAADDIVKGWTLRGTMHIFAEADLPLFLPKLTFLCFCTAAAAIEAGTGRSHPSGTSARTGHSRRSGRRISPI